MIKKEKTKILVITGPTATGKSSVSIELAKKYNGEIISADSMQIYKYLNIGTAKITNDEMRDIPHHLVDFLEPSCLFSVADFVKMANEKIEQINSNGKLPIIVGGTGLYISSLVNGIEFTEQKTDLSIRNKLEEELNLYGIEYLHKELLKIDNEYANKIDFNNHKRVLRALELYRQTGVTMSQQIENSKPKELPYDANIFILNYKDRQLLYDKINSRIDIMINEGLIEEAKFVYDNKSEFITAAQAIGYKELFPYFEKTDNLENCIEKLKQATRRYAKRQITWFKKIENSNWIMLDNFNENNILKDYLIKELSY